MFSLSPLWARQLLAIRALDPTAASPRHIRRAQRPATFVQSIALPSQAQNSDPPRSCTTFRTDATSPVPGDPHCLSLSRIDRRGFRRHICAFGIARESENGSQTPSSNLPARRTFRTLAQKDRRCSRLWRASFCNPRQFASGCVPWSMPAKVYPCSKPL